MNALRRLRTLALLAALAAAMGAACTHAQTGTVPLRSSPASVETAHPSAPEVIASDITSGFRDFVDYFSAPLSFGPDDWTRVAAGAGAVGAVMAMDEGLNRLMTRDGRTGALDKPLHWGSEWGRLRTMQYASLGVWLTGLVSEKGSVRVTGRLMGEALILAGLPAIALQYGLGRSRPYSREGAWKYNFLEWGNERQSLPSGHATVAFAISTVLARRLGGGWAGAPFYGAAGLTALSLGRTNQHWPSDLLIGAILGYLAGNYVVQREEDRSGDAGRERGENRRRIEAGIGPGGVTLIYRIY